MTKTPETPLTNTATKRWFNLRAFASLTLFFTFFAVVGTGLVIYFEPRQLASQKWGSVHVAVGLVLAAAGLVHLFHNFRSLLSYVRSRASETRGFKKEGIVAFLLVLAVIAYASREGPLFRKAPTLAQGDVTLVKPDTEGGIPLMRSLALRKSSRNFVGGRLTDEQLSTLLWAASGVNRPGKEGRTYPSGLGVKSVSVYALTADGLYLYEATTHTLHLVKAGDFRAETTISQDYVKDAALSLVYVEDAAAWANIVYPATPEELKVWATFSAGAMSQSVSLTAESLGLGCVVRASIPHEVFARLAGLSKTQEVLMAQSVGLVPR